MPHAERSGLGQQDSDFIDQGVTVEVIHSVLVGVSTVTTSSLHYIDIVLYGGSSGDFIAILDRSLPEGGCQGAVSAKSTFECTSDIGEVAGYSWAAYCVYHTPSSQSNLASKEYKVCWAPKASSGDEDADFIEQALGFTDSSKSSESVLSLQVENIAGASFGSYGVKGISLSKDSHYLYITDSSQKNIKIVDIDSKTQFLFFAGDNTFSGVRGICSHGGNEQSVFVALSAHNKIVEIRHESPNKAESVYINSFSGVCGGSYKPYDIIHDHPNNFLYVLCGKSNGGSIRRIDTTGGALPVTLLSSLGSAEPQNWAVVHGENGVIEGAYVTNYKSSYMTAKVQKISFANSGISEVFADGLLRHPRGVAISSDQNKLYVQERTFKGIVGGKRRDYHSAWKQTPFTKGKILPDFPIGIVYRNKKLYSVHREDHGSIHVVDVE